MRKKTQTEKELQGTFEPSKEVLDMVSYEDLAKVPNVPTEWPVEAQDVWREIGRVLKMGGWMTAGTIMPMRRLAWSYYRTLLAEVALISNPKDSFWSRELIVNSKEVKVWCEKFGLTPIDIMKVPVRKKDEKTPDSLLD